MNEYRIGQHTTSAHGTYWTLITPDGMPFGLRYFSEEQARKALADYEAARKSPGPRSLCRALGPREEGR